MSDFIVIRIHPDLIDFVPGILDGMWMDRGKMIDEARHWPEPEGMPTAVAVPTGRFEIRSDGAVAEVYEFQP